MHPPTTEGVARLHDGRTLGYAVFGAGPRVALWFHGTPGGRRQVPPAARRFAHEHGIRVIGIERPGIGDSTPHLYDHVRDFADDVSVLLEQLSIESCAVVGLSGGGPYALACAHALPHVRICGVLGGVAPSCGPEGVAGGVSTLARFAPGIAPVQRPLGALLSMTIRAAHPIASPGYDLFKRLCREPDREVFEAPGIKPMFLDDILRGSRSGLRSLLYDYLLFSRPWNFSIAEVRVPVHFWHGDADAFVPLTHGQHQAALAPQSTLTIQPGQSHLGGLMIADEVLAKLMA
ncbi:MAG: alpha/beta hydrolase [Myxococcota bacterium]